jgi:hypothetical protein
MNKILIFLYLFLSIKTFANVVVRINPERPAKEETFQIIFELSSPFDENANINFNPMGIEIIGKEVGSKSTRTVFVNGKLIVEKKVTIIYSSLAKSMGIKYLNDIVIEQNGKNLKIPSKSIYILNEAEAPKDVFAQADISSTEVFVGQSVEVKYYLYHAVPLQEFQIDKYAKLDKFLKRFHQDSNQAERVEYNGKIYTRRIVYTAQLFPMEIGEFEIDPMVFTVRYSEGRADPFGSIFSSPSVRKSISSRPVKIITKPLPSSSVPKNFTGLVGKHSFEIELNRTKFLVNEPIEMKFKVRGPGALEVYESPLFIDNDGIEGFVANSDLSFDSSFKGTKTFDLTYLPRKSINLSKKEIALSYFDPVSEQYLTETIVIPDLVVLQTQAEDFLKTSESKKDVSDENEKSINVERQFFKFYFINIYMIMAQKIGFFLVVLLLFVSCIFIFLYFNKKRKYKIDIDDYIIENGIDYYSLMQLFEGRGHQGPLYSTLKSLHLSSEVELYWLQVLEKIEKNFMNKINEKIKIDKVKFKVLLKSLM